VDVCELEFGEEKEEKSENSGRDISLCMNLLLMRFGSVVLCENTFPK
jgi:hypothetical protein